MCVESVRRDCDCDWDWRRIHISPLWRALSRVLLVSLALLACCPLPFCLVISLCTVFAFTTLSVRVLHFILLLLFFFCFSLLWLVQFICTFVYIKLTAFPPTLNTNFNSNWFRYNWITINAENSQMMRRRLWKKRELSKYRRCGCLLDVCVCVCECVGRSVCVCLCGARVCVCGVCTRAVYIQTHTHTHSCVSACMNIWQIIRKQKCSSPCIIKENFKM